ncbi:protein CBFA2T3-like isoform X2 [Paramacrobiotus metropolitanus]|uniref:protein CBFA2T3-like isoform X2 n=1 Tax=Paramacrobiotus metropolitanus TaxID=2943436 RepID=UPI002445CF09|nr:protein CBFA2T3-like isoform X2 [Paramacrobiotus metropolitanus]
MDELSSTRHSSPASCGSCYTSSRCSSVISSLIVDDPSDLSVECATKAMDVPEICSEDRKAENPPISTAAPLDLSKHHAPRTQPNIWAPYENVIAAGACNGDSGSDGVDVDIVLPATCGARQLNKLKRFLTSIQQAAADVSSGSAEQVRLAIWSLVNNKISAEEFVSHVQSADVPLKRFIVPFVKANLPHLQRELLLLSQHTQLLTRTPENLMGPNKDQFTGSANEIPISPSIHREPASCVSTSAMFPQLFHHLRTGRDEKPLSKGQRDAKPLVQTNVAADTQRKSQFADLNRLDNIPLRVANLAQRLNHLLQWYAFEKAETSKMFTNSPKSNELEQYRKSWAQWLAMHNLTRMESESMTVELAMLSTITGQHDIINQIHKSLMTLKTQLDHSTAHMREAEHFLKIQNSAAPAMTTSSMATTSGEKKGFAAVREPCWSCGRPAKKLCAGCQKAKYCERNCQEDDWPVHGRNCKVATLLPPRNL